MDDQALLRQYVAERSQAAFAEIVRRHVDLVYSAALRMVRNAELAEDVTQAVFVALACRAQSVRNADALGGWLYRVTHHQAANAIRAERTRRHHEREAMMEPRARARARNASESDEWESIAPHLDEAMATLHRKDQDAIVQRFFQGRSWREVGAAMALSEDAAQKRVGRALERLRACLSRRGVTISAAMLAVMLTTNAVHAAPPALASAATKTSLAAAATYKPVAITLGGNIVTKIALGTLAALAIGVTTAQLVAQKETADPAPAAPTAAPTALTDGLVLHMTFDQQEADGKVSDGSPEKNHGKATGARWTSDGHRAGGGAFEFRNDGDRIVVKNNKTLNPPSVTVGAWIKTNVADGEWRRIIDKSWDKGYAMSIAGKFEKYNWSGQVCMEIGPGEHFSVTDVKVSDGQWHHVLATCDGIEQRLYVDGTLNGKVHMWKEPADVGATEHNLTIGCNQSNPPGSRDLNQSFRGLIDEPMIWNRALSAEEVAELYASQK